MPAILANTDVYAFPSSLEPFGMGPVEAMAAGVPVVATSVGGLAEIVTDGVNGLLVPPLAPAALAGAVVRLCREAGLRERLIAAGQERANDFDVARGMERLVRHFREVAR
jgi:glycosyltransferase involved in cell wall biosynthesis